MSNKTIDFIFWKPTVETNGEPGFVSELNFLDESSQRSANKTFEFNSDTTTFIYINYTTGNIETPTSISTLEFTITTDSSGYAQNPIIINGGDYYNYGDEIIIYESEHNLGGDINGYGAPTEIRLIVTSTTSAAWKIDNGPIEFWNPSTSNITQYNFNNINNVIIENNDINGNNIENLVIYKDIYDSYETFLAEPFIINLWKENQVIFILLHQLQ